MNKAVAISLKSVLVKFIIIQLAFFTIPTCLIAQNKNIEKRFSLSVKEEKLEKVLDKLTKKTGIYFSYNSDLISEKQRFTLSVKDHTLYEFLDKVLIGTSLRYKLIKKQVIIYRKTKDQLNPKEKISLFGTVRDANTKEPISGVNVFISGSLKGSSSDKFGNFAIDELYPNIYEIVFSHVAYDIRLMTINAKHKKPSSFSVILIPKTIQLKEVEINATKEKNWNYHYYLFESEFLGNTINAARCEIVNSEAITFKFDREKQVLTAKADQPLIIENYALGYEIQYFLESFENDDKKSVIHGVLNFREISPGSKKETRQWRKNRKKSYYGSYTHFLKALYNNKLRKEGFRIYLADTVGSKNITQISEDEILSESRKDLNVKMAFDNFLKIEFVRSDYRNQNERIREYYSTENGIQNGIQTSYLKLNLPYTTILKNGFLKEQFAVTKYGYWSWERVAEYLPFEYKP